MLSTWPNLLARRDLVRQVTLSELKSSRMQTRFGWVWWLIDPLVMMTMYWGIVVGLMGRGKVQYAPYPIFILIALITWKHFSSSVGNCSRVLSSHEALIKSVAFPTMVLPLSRVLSGFTFFLFGLGVVAVAALVAPNEHHSGAILPLVQLPALLVLQLCIVTGCALVVACLGVLVKDLRNFLGYILRIGFYGSASLYGLDMVQDKLTGPGAPEWGPAAFFAFTLNPFALLITGYRDVLFYGRFMLPQYWLTLVIESVLVLLGGYLVYQHYDRRVIKFL